MDLTDPGRVGAETAAPADAAAELARLQSALRVAERRLADVQQAAGLCSWYADLDGGNLQFSSAVGAVLGIDTAPGALDAGHIRQRVHPDDLAGLRADRARMLRGEPQVTSRFRFRRDDGRPCWLESRVTRLLPQADHPGGLVGTVHDVTELMHSQQHLERHRSRLEDLVVSRTVQLAQASERAEAAGLARSTFVAHTSHEVRTPLNVIVTLAHLLRRGEADATRLDRLRTIEQAARHVGSIIDDLLDPPAADDGPPGQRSDRLEPERLLVEAAAMLRAQAASAGLQLDVQSSAVDRSRQWLGDATRLRQALLIAGRWALSVASRADGADSGILLLRVRVEAEPEADGQATLRFEAVADAPALSVDPEADAELASLRRLSAQMGGDSGRSDPAEGPACCWFTARVACHASADDVAPTHGEQTVRDLKRRHAGRRVLVAEDDAVNQAVMRELLGDVGLVVDIAEDGQHAIERAAQRRYALVVMDLSMPRLGGLDAARAMRARPEMADVPIVAVTANAFAEDRAACRAVGMNDFLPKPIDVDRLNEMLLQWLDRSPVSAASERVPPAPTPPPREDPAAARAGAAVDGRLSPFVGLEGVDAMGGLGAVGGRVETYLRLLGVFIDAHQADGAVLLQALHDGDPASAGRVAHRLRGSAATLGLVDVETAAAALENDIDIGEPASSRPMLAQAVDRALASTVAQLRAALGR